MMNGLGSETDKGAIDRVECMVSLPEQVQRSLKQNQAV